MSCTNVVFVIKFEIGKILILQYYVNYDQMYSFLVNKNVRTQIKQL